MAPTRLLELEAPIEYREIRLPYQVVRAVGALLVASLGIAGSFAYDIDGWAYIVFPALAVGIHALVHLVKPGGKATTSMAIDITAIGLVLLLIGPVPQVQMAALAYVVIAATLLTSMVEALALLTYMAAWSAAIVTLAPVADTRALESHGAESLAGLASLTFIFAGLTLLVAASRLIHRFRQAQTESLEAERRAAEIKGEFVSMVSHEFRTPLTSVVGFVDMLRESWTELGADEIDEFLQIIHDEGAHLSNLVEDVLAIPRLEAGAMPLELEDFEMATAAQQVLDTVFPPGSPHDTAVVIQREVVVRGDRRRVVQVLRNLLENALKYGGDQVLVEGRPDGEMYQVVVADNGRGVPAEHRGRIFNHFEQGTSGDARTDSGIGLGLPIAQRLVDAMGGELWYEPRFPTGSQFCFTLRQVESQSTLDVGAAVRERLVS